MRGATQARRSSRIELKAAAAPVPRRRASTRSAGLILTLAVLHGLCLLWLHLLWLWMLAMAILVMAILTTSSERAPIAWAAGAETQTLLLYSLWLFFERLYLLRLELRAGAKAQSGLRYYTYTYYGCTCYGIAMAARALTMSNANLPPHHHRITTARALSGIKAPRAG